MYRDWLNLSWKLLIARGALGIVFGIVAMAWPKSTAIAFAILWGFWALFEGIGALVQAFSPGATGRVWLVVMGVIALIASFFAIFSPAVTAVALTWILGIWLIVRGLFEFFGAFSASGPTPRWLLFAGALLSVALGVLFVANPGASVVGLAFWLGVVAFAWGIAFVVLGFMLRSEASHAAAPPPAPSMP